ncbi:MAG: oligosaccharide flippase family protein [Lachnospiraceae bacterium]|nr:oligosaccharide flippase family protein [Lachnospiraceae bacterium]
MRIPQLTNKLLHNPLIGGTLLLTLTGLLSKVIGFFFKIFLSRTIGAEGVGIYQLIFPVYAMGIAFSASGIQTAISRNVAAASGKPGSAHPIQYLYAGLFLSLILSLLAELPIYFFSDELALTILDEPRCSSLLRIVSYALPFACVHSCVNGYYYGQKKTAIPAVTQLAEQCVRVFSAYILVEICLEKQLKITPALAVWGIVCGEIASMLISLTCLRLQKLRRGFCHALRSVAVFAVPLTANHVTYHAFSSVEAILIPLQLKAFGYSNSDALSVFGILTGMAMPMILFPSALTNSVSVLLMPTISEAVAKKDLALVRKATQKTIIYCLLLGFACTGFFLLTGGFIGQYIFHNTLAGNFIRILGWICPFLYLATTLSSILHGLGKPATAFYINLGGCTLRILCILLLIPSFGIRSYLYSMLASQLLVAGLCIKFSTRPDFS